MFTLLLLPLALPTLTEVYLEEGFDGPDAAGLEGWVKSEAAKGDAPYDGPWEVKEVDNSTDTTVANSALVAIEGNHHYAISKYLVKPFVFEERPLVVQYSVRYQETMTCGGSYMKLVSAGDDVDLMQLRDDTMYTILFGPDKCGPDAKLMFIFNFKNPATGNFREVHSKKIPNAQQLLFNDKKAHLVTLAIRPDNTFLMMIDENPVLSGKMGSEDESETGKSLHPQKTIDDPDDHKPDDWVDEKEMDDPDDVQPGDWVTEALIDDPSASQPDDWDEEMDGEWEPPQIKNPAYKGEFKAKRIENPAYKGQWAPRQLDNPEYFKEDAPFAKLIDVVAIAYEVWTVTGGVAYDDVIITDDEAEATANAARWRAQRKYEDENAVTGVWLFDTFNAITGPAQKQPLLWPIYILVVVLPIYALFSPASVDATRNNEEGVKNTERENTDRQDDGDDDSNAEGSESEE